MRRALLVAGLASFAALGPAHVQLQQINVAKAHGAQIDIAQAFLAGSQADESLKDKTVIYTKHGELSLPLDIHRPKARTDGRAAQRKYCQPVGATVDATVSARTRGKTLMAICLDNVLTA